MAADHFRQLHHGHRVDLPRAFCFALHPRAPTSLILAAGFDNLLIGDVRLAAGDARRALRHTHPACRAVRHDNPHRAVLGFKVNLQRRAGYEGIQHVLRDVEAILRPRAAFAGESIKGSNGRCDLAGDLLANLHGVNLPRAPRFALQARAPGGLVFAAHSRNLLIGNLAGILAAVDGGRTVIGNARPACRRVRQDNPHRAVFGFVADFNHRTGHQRIEEFLRHFRTVLTPAAAFVGKVRELHRVRHVVKIGAVFLRHRRNPFRRGIHRQHVAFRIEELDVGHIEVTRRFAVKLLGVDEAVHFLGELQRVAAARHERAFRHFHNGSLGVLAFHVDRPVGGLLRAVLAVDHVHLAGLRIELAVRAQFHADIEGNLRQTAQVFAQQAFHVQRHIRHLASRRRTDAQRLAAVVVHDAQFARIGIAQRRVHAEEAEVAVGKVNDAADSTRHGRRHRRRSWARHAGVLCERTRRRDDARSQQNRNNLLHLDDLLKHVPSQNLVPWCNHCNVAGGHAVGEAGNPCRHTGDFCTRFPISVLLYHITKLYR